MPLFPVKKTGTSEPQKFDFYLGNWGSRKLDRAVGSGLDWKDAFFSFPLAEASQPIFALLLLLFLVFPDRISLCSPGWPGTP